MSIASHLALWFVSAIVIAIASSINDTLRSKIR